MRILSFSRESRERTFHSPFHVIRLFEALESFLSFSSRASGKVDENGGKCSVKAAGDFLMLNKQERER